VNIEVLKRQIAPAACRFLTATGLYRLATPIYGGLGCILNFHRVLPAGSGPRVPSVRALEVTPDWLAQSIDFVRTQGLKIIGPDDLVAMLRGEIPQRRFVIYTFDDGYEDNLVHALPVFREKVAPFTVYVATGFPERTLIPWWQLLEDLILAQPRLQLRLGGASLAFDCATDAGREDAFYTLRSAMLEGMRKDYRGTLDEVFGPFGIDPFRHSGLGLSWDQVRDLARDPRVTIGSHGCRHVPLAKLPEAEMILELTESRRILEEQLGRPVRHLAYPYGATGEAGPREFAAAQAAGYLTAVTTRPANVFPEHRDHLTCLPRNLVSGEREGRNLPFMKLWFSGTIPALENRLRRVVTL